MIYYFELDYGCGIGEARDLKSAERRVRIKEGTAHVRLVRKAAKEDISHVASMGGWLPESVRK